MRVLHILGSLYKIMGVAFWGVPQTSEFLSKQGMEIDLVVGLVKIEKS